MDRRAHVWLLELWTGAGGLGFGAWGSKGSLEDGAGSRLWISRPDHVAARCGPAARSGLRGRLSTPWASPPCEGPQPPADPIRRCSVQPGPRGCLLSFLY